MAIDKAFVNNKRETKRSADLLQDHITGTPIGDQKFAKDVAISQYAFEASTNSIVSATATTLEITSHGATRGDKIEFTSGVLADREISILKIIDANNVEISENLSTLPSAADTVRVLRPRTPIVGDDGSITVSSGPLQFKRDGSNQDVIEDTVTPANNRPLPVKLTNVTGDINITANDLHVQLDHADDSVKIGDGTDLLAISAAGEASTSDATAHTKLDTLETTLTSVETDTAVIAGDTTSLDAKLPAQGAALTAASTPVNIASDQTVPISAASLPLPTGASTEATLSSLNGKDFATQTTLAALLTELQLKADLAETQPVSMASAPLPTGAATEVTLSSVDTELALKLDESIYTGRTGEVSATPTANTILGRLKDIDDAHTSLLTELQAKADLAETQPVSAAALPLPTGAATEVTLAALAAEDFATQTTLAALLTELQAKADLAETQPVSAASLPLPTGASTEVTSAALLTELQLKADLSETQPVSLASQPLPTGAATETTLASLLTELQLKADLSETQPVSLASQPLPTGAATEAKQDTLIAALSELDVKEFVRNDYTGTSVTTGAYVQLIASTGAETKRIQIFDSSGQTLVLALGAAASEVDKLYIFPGGNGDIDVAIPAATRVSIKAVSATADAGEISINLMG